MGRIPGTIICFCLFFSLCLAANPQVAQAESQQNKVANIVLDTVIGVTAGVLVGVTFSAVQGGDHWRSNIIAGSAIGAVAGLTYGLATGGRPIWGPHALLTIEGGKTQISVPTVITTVNPSPSNKGQEIACGVHLMDVRF